jgi:hypothetical protein
MMTPKSAAYSVSRMMSKFSFTQRKHGAGCWHVWTS